MYIYMYVCMFIYMFMYAYIKFCVNNDSLLRLTAYVSTSYFSASSKTLSCVYVCVYVYVYTYMYIH